MYSLINEAIQTIAWLRIWLFLPLAIESEGNGISKWYVHAFGGGAFKDAHDMIIAYYSNTGLQCIKVGRQKNAITNIAYQEK